MSTQYTDEHRKRFLVLLEENTGNITRTCKQMGIKGAHQTIKNWRSQHPWFDQAIEEYVHSVFDVLESNVFKTALDESVRAMFDPTVLSARKFLLTHHPQGRKRGYRPRGEITGEDGGPVQVRSFVELVNRVEERMIGEGDPVPPEGNTE